MTRWMRANRSTGKSCSGATCCSPALLTRMSTSTSRRSTAVRVGQVDRLARPPVSAATSLAAPALRSTTITVAPAARQPQGARPPDAAAAAGDQGGAAGEVDAVRRGGPPRVLPSWRMKLRAECAPAHGPEPHTPGQSCVPTPAHHSMRPTAPACPAARSAAWACVHLPRHHHRDRHRVADLALAAQVKKAKRIKWRPKVQDRRRACAGGTRRGVGASTILGAAGRVPWGWWEAGQLGCRTHVLLTAGEGAACACSVWTRG